MNPRKFQNTTIQFYPKNNPRLRLLALWYFTILMIVWNVLGHTVLGFEQAWATPLVAVATALGMQMLLDWVDARARNREVRFAGSWKNFVNFLPAAFIPGFACGMLLYPNERLWPIVFAVVLSIGSKLIFRAPVGGGRFQHIFNPSNFGVALTLVLFPQVGFAPPYHFTENTAAIGDWAIPGVVLLSGIFIHAVATGRLPLIFAWVGGFVLQGVFRAWLSGTPLYVPLMPMTSAAFIVFTLYMVPDPATTPILPRRQVLFGFSVAMVYGVIQMLHLVFGLFFALLFVCAVRGVFLHLGAYLEKRRGIPAAEPVLGKIEPAPEAAVLRSSRAGDGLPPGSEGPT